MSFSLSTREQRRRKSFPDVSSDSSVCANRGVPSTKSNKGTSHKVFMARLSHFALGENWESFPSLSFSGCVSLEMCSSGLRGVDKFPKVRHILRIDECCLRFQ